jgi:O-antigen/teichoic acid export membrane protein
MDRRIGSEALLVAIGQAGGAIGLLIAVRILTNALSQADYGVLVLGLTISTLVSQTVLGPLANAAQRFLASAHQDGQVPEFWVGVRTLGLAGSTAVLAVGIAASVVGGLTSGPTLGLVILTSTAFAVLSGWEVVFDAAQSAERRRGIVAWHQALRQWLRPLFALFVISITGGGVVAALAGYVLASFVGVVSQVFRSSEVSRNLLRRFRSPFVFRLWRFAAPFVSWGVFTWAHLSSDRWALTITGGPQLVASYAVVFQLGAQPVYLFAASAAQLIEPIVYARAGAGADARRVRDAFVLNMRVATAGAGLVLVLALAEVIWHAEMFAILAAPEYESVSHFLPLAALSAGVFGVGQLIALGSLIVANSRVLVAPKVVSSILGIALNVLGASFFGITGVLLAGLISGLIYGVWTTALGFKLMSAYK